MTGRQGDPERRAQANTGLPAAMLLQRMARSPVMTATAVILPVIPVPM
jgi:hypothetical protein